MSRAWPRSLKASRRPEPPVRRPPRRADKALPGSAIARTSSHPRPATRWAASRSRDTGAPLSTRCCGGPRSRPPPMRWAVTSTRSAEALGLACCTATTCRACRGPPTNSQAAAVIHVAACCGPRVTRALHRARDNAQARGNSSRAPQQRPRDSMPRVKHRRRSWGKPGSALLRTATGFACRAAP